MCIPKRLSAFKPLRESKNFDQSASFSEIRLKEPPIDGVKRAELDLKLLCAVLLTRESLAYLIGLILHYKYCRLM